MIVICVHSPLAQPSSQLITEVVWNRDTEYGIETTQYYCMYLIEINCRKRGILEVTSV